MLLLVFVSWDDCGFSVISEVGALYGLEGAMTEWGNPAR